MDNERHALEAVSFKQLPGYVRPSTRRELLDLLISGVACEVASDIASMTALVLTGWLNFPSFTFRPSENIGWTLFEKAYGNDNAKL